MTTIHANNAEQALTRLAHCVLTADVGLPHRSTREAIGDPSGCSLSSAGRQEGRRRRCQGTGLRSDSDRFVVEAWSPPQAVQEGATADQTREARDRDSRRRYVVELRP
jgi:Flp pilus assembly CpaF family ATPase